MAKRACLYTQYFVLSVNVCNLAMNLIGADKCVKWIASEPS